MRTDDGDVAQVGTLFVVHPCGVVVSFVECIAMGVVVAVDVAAFDVHLEVIIVAQLVGEFACRSIIGMHEVVDVECAAIAAERYDVEAALQAHTVGISTIVVGHLAVSCNPAGPQLGSLLHFAFDHDIQYPALVGIDTGRVVHVGVCIMAKP